MRAEGFLNAVRPCLSTTSFRCSWGRSWLVPHFLGLTNIAAQVNFSLWEASVYGEPEDNSISHDDDLTGRAGTQGGAPAARVLQATSSQSEALPQAFKVTQSLAKV